LRIWFSALYRSLSCSTYRSLSESIFIESSPIFLVYRHLRRDPLPAPRVWRGCRVRTTGKSAREGAAGMRGAAPVTPGTQKMDEMGIL
jgi:hypothetical protein